MPDSDITVSGLTISPGIGHNLARWTVSDPNADGLPYRKLDRVELWASETNDRDSTDLIKVSEGQDSAPHMGLVEGQTFYYWIKARDQEGSYGDWYPSGSTSGVEAEALVSTGTTAAGGLANAKIVCSDSGGDLTIALKTLANADPSPSDPIFITFNASGVVSVAKIDSALSLTIPSGATLGVGAGDPFKLWVFALQAHDESYVSLAVVNYGLDQGVRAYEVNGIRSRTTMSTSSDSAGVLYSDAANSSNRYRIVGEIGFYDSDALATPGTWVAPSAPGVEVVFTPGNFLPGQIVNVVEKVITASSTITTTIPNDDTTPIYGEGEDLIEVDFNPFDQLNVVTIEALVNCSFSTAANIILAARCAGTDATAFAAGWTYCAAAGAACQVALKATVRVFDLIALGGIGAVTFAIGADGAGTLTINGDGGSRKLGGAMTSWFRVTERKG